MPRKRKGPGRPRAERCGECDKPLPKDAHWNRRFCVPCRKKRDRRSSKRKPGRRPARRPTMCTPARIRLICDAAGLGAYQRHCAAHAGVSEHALLRWLQQGHDALVDAGLDPEAPPDDAAEHVAPEVRCYVDLRTRYLRTRARGCLTLLQAQQKAGVGGAVYEPDPNALPPAEYAEIVKTLKAAGRADLIPALKRPQQVQVGFLEPDARACARALAVSHGYTEKTQVELSGAVETAQPALCFFLPELDKDDD